MLSRITRLCLIPCICWISFATHAAKPITQKIIYGYVENVMLAEKNLVLPAKLDTGAKSASLNAINIERIKKHGKIYLRFLVPGKWHDTQFECEYIGKTRIKLRKSEWGPQAEFTRRPVVLMHVIVGAKEQQIRVNLTDRRHFAYPLLLGREAIMAFDGLIDSSVKYRLAPHKSKTPAPAPS